MDGAGAAALRLAPHAVLLRRSATELQIGVEPSVVVPHAYAGLVRALAAGAGADRLERAAHEHGLHLAAVPDLLSALHGARLLEPRPTGPSRAVRVVGAGPLAARVARALLDAGFPDLYVADLPERPGPAEAPDGGRRTRRRPQPSEPDRVDALVAALAGRGPGSRPAGAAGVRVHRTRHFVKPEGGVVALTVVVADGPEPDRLVTDLLREHGAPHLLVRCSGDEAVVGPLVVPGLTSCVRCADLARRDADPCWPGLLDQLTRLRLEPAPTLLAWAAVTAVVQALAFDGGGRPETLGHTLELTADEHTMRLRAWSVHPECPCRWAAPPPPGTARG